MDQINARDKDTELDLERGLAVTEDISMKESSLGTPNQQNPLFANLSGGSIGGFLTKEDRPNFNCNESNVVDVTNKLSAVQDTVDVEKPLVKEKRKKASSKKASKPPRPPRVQPLDAADQKLIRELSELALLKRARIERMKALKKMRASKPSSSNSSIFAMVFTIVFCIVIIVQGLSSGKSSVENFQGSPLPTKVIEGGPISVHYNLNPSASNPNAPSSESNNNFVKQVTGSYLSGNQKKSRLM
ncbi:uncharacterized protein G2W53_006176 [Senna tora]|uniref:Transmembrane protein n=1 Tax=Senna tora TaxID=362788 RepID=A0A834X4G5_9FABA|nr:uncharacterized protein G2W53_006176 [Senna tora]